MEKINEKDENQKADKKPVSFLDFLVQTDKISAKEASDLMVASLSPQEQSKALVKRKVFDQDFITEYFKIWEATEQSHILKVDLDGPKLPEKLAREFSAILLHSKDHHYVVGIRNPLDGKAKHLIRMHYDGVVEFKLVESEVLLRTIEKLYRQTHKAGEYAKEAIELAEGHKIHQLKPFEIIQEGTNTSVSTLFDSILEDAFNLQTSDIHIEANSDIVEVRYRLSGSLVKQMQFSPEIKNILLRHIIARSGGDISEMRMPQDTSFTYVHKGHEVGIRCSALFSLTGYSIVLRLLMPADSYFDLESILNEPQTYKILKEMLDAGNGMLIVTGPTSSGKTTLLYNALMYVAQQSRKILTAEDPVEVELPGLTQVQVFPEIGLDYDEVIKTALRQNPDALMLGEIRDGETASMAMRAAITGIMVAATLHTKNVTSTVLRLTDLGVSMPLIATGLKLIVAARLCRKLCPNCKEPYDPPKEERDNMAKMVSDEQWKKGEFYRPKGCEDCMNTGYAGLKGVYECLKFDAPIVAALAQNDVDTFRKASFDQIRGNTLGDNIVRFWRMGITSYEEASKLVFNG